MKLKLTRDAAEVKCPVCSEKLIRIARDYFMRLWPGSKHYMCNECHSRYYQNMFGYLRKL
jgi:predicted RNA-binding Zn-ribbon protein involved in translation (DUF1610 family)